MTPADQIKTTSDLRRLLLEVIVDTKHGHLSVDKARTITKLSEQVNKGLSVEIQAWKMAATFDEPLKKQRYGALPLTTDTF